MMDDLRTRAQLVDLDHAGAIGTVVTRAEIAEAAAGAEFPATLLLDLDRAEAQARVAVDWDKDTLEKLLASTEDDEIGLWFDENELAMAFAEVEGHGIRQRAAVLTLAVAAAGATSAPAFARMAAEPSGGGGAATNSVTAIAQAGVQRGLLQDQAVSQGLGADQAASRPDPAGDKTAVLAGTERGLVQNQRLSQNLSTDQTSVTSSGGGSSLSTGELAGAIAGGVLVITAAGFAVARKRTPPALPA